jgi:hypothetical protein
MKRSEVVRLAYEAGCKSIIVPEEWFKFAKLVAAAEREACAKVCEEWLHGEWHNQGVIAAMMIRERGAP